ncbi:MAG: 4Fe-4S dicluster domain-containing protein [Bacteroidetes bacterium]|nr:4Fe-4S dicluster domain-containing protein [Bacteroidota bacterium]
MAQGAPGRPTGAVRRGDSSQPVAVYNRWCKGCSICVEFCPQKVLELSSEGKAIVARPEKCTRCRLCEVLCPDFAVTVSPKQEKASVESEPDGPEGEPVAKGRAK